MKNVRQLLFIFMDDFYLGKNTKQKDFDSIITFVKERGYLLKDHNINYAPVAVECNLPKEISIDECIKLVHAIDSIGKYQVTQFTFSTEYGGYDMQQPPCAEISLRKTSSK